MKFSRLQPLDEGYAWIGWERCSVEHQEGESARREAYYSDGNDAADPLEVPGWLTEDFFSVPLL